MKPINTSIFDFPTLLAKGCVYVDKTAQIYELVKPSADGIYFFPRPRRFGKSLLISTLKALFQGRRELFRGLAIEKTDWDWEHEVYPVLHLDMSVVAARDPVVFEQNLGKMMELKCAEFGVPYDPNVVAATNFEVLLTALREKSTSADKKYVLLIDEYDSPIAGMLDTPERRAKLDEIRAMLHDFYVKAKAHCGDMRLLMVTGVSKFAKTSIFSAFNNPVDLSLDARAADLVGYTHEEMERYFHEHISAFADKRGKSYGAAFAELLAWYDSYQFSPEKLVKVINPVSLGRALSTGVLKDYWEATAGSTLVYDALKAGDSSPFDLASQVAVNTLDAADALDAPAVALLYQGGYLTIDRRITDERILLKIPNHEVRQSLEHGYISRLLGRDFQIDNFQFTAEDSAAQLAAEGYTDAFRTMLQSAFALLPHDWVCKDEKEVKRYFIAYMCFARAEIAGEPQHATGRPDAVLRTEKGIYVFEFKFAQSADAALAQCRARNYAARFVGENLPVHYVGVNYNPAADVRTIDDVKCELADA